jgi:protein-L-isoaspartate(D-aspartate) O-methyltransferase
MKRKERQRRLALLFDTAAILVMAVLGITIPLGTGASADCDQEKYSSQRKKMVARQIVARGVRNPAVIEAMKTVPRHCFVPEDQRHRAYRDGPLPIGHGQTISQPYVVAIMSEMLKVKPGQRVLEVGTGSGYQAAVLAAMGIEVFTIEIVAPLGEKATQTLKDLGYDTVHTRIGDGYEGWPRQAPFDGIIVTAAPSRIPQPLKEQLAENGRMVIPVGPAHGIQQLCLLRKINGEMEQETIFDVRFVPMVDEKGKRY